jgi:hypothetical protein
MNEFKRMQKLAGIITESQLNENEINPVTKKKFDNLLAMAEKAVASKDKESLQKIYDKALTTGSKGWKYFIQALYDKGLAHQDGAYLKWNLDESQLNEDETYNSYPEWLDALYKTYPFIKGNEDKYLHKSEYFTNASRGLESFGSWYNGKGKTPGAIGRVYAPHDISSNVYPQGSRKD